MKINNTGSNNTITIASSAKTEGSILNIKGDFNSVIIGKNCIIENCLFNLSLGCRHTIVIGNGVHMYESEIVFEDNDNSFIVGNQTTIFQKFVGCILEPNVKLSIGNNCLFSNHISIRTGDSHSIIDIATNKRINPAKDVILEDHIWVCEFVRILKGAHIQSNSVIGAGAVVTGKTFAPNCLIGGNPAKEIKNNINWNPTLL